MKRILFAILAGVFCVSLFSQVTPYGSARINYWYENTSKDMNNYNLGIDKARLSMNYGLQPNTRFGLNFKHDALTGKIEFGISNNLASLRLAYGKYNFDGYSLLIGQDFDGTAHFANQAWGADNGLIGYGNAYAGRNPQIKFEMNNGLYFALIRPHTAGDPANLNSSIDAIIPKINLGYNYKLDNLKIMPTFMFQTYQYNKDFNSNDIDETVNSWLFATTTELKASSVLLKAQVNYGVNTGNMGVSGSGHRAVWVQADSKLEDTATMGGFLQLAYEINPNFVFDTGLGYSSSSNSTYKDSDNKDVNDSKMAVYAQTRLKFNSLIFVPEIGLINEMEDSQGVKRGSRMYFGTQLRYDF